MAPHAGCCSGDGVPQRRKPENQEGAHDEDHENSAPAQKGGLNWTAFFFLCLFVLPAAVGMLISVSDWMYPEAAYEREIRSRVDLCYGVANPDKLSEVDNILLKYKGKERKLMAKLRAKYGEFPECQRLR